MRRLCRGSLSIRPSRARFTGLLSSLRRSVVMALFSSNPMNGSWGSQARYLSRPEYRVTSEGTKAQLHQVNLASLTFFWIQCWLSTGVTQPAAHTFGEAPNWAQYSWVIAKAASRGSATSITHCSKTGAAAARSRLALCSAPDTGRGRGRQNRSAAEPRLFAKGVRSKSSMSLPTSRAIRPFYSPLFSRTREERFPSTRFESSIKRT